MQEVHHYVNLYKSPKGYVWEFRHLSHDIEKGALHLPLFAVSKVLLLYCMCIYVEYLLSRCAACMGVHVHVNGAFTILRLIIMLYERIYVYMHAVKLLVYSPLGAVDLARCHNLFYSPSFVKTAESFTCRLRSWI